MRKLVCVGLALVAGCGSMTSPDGGLEPPGPEDSGADAGFVVDAGPMTLTQGQRCSADVQCVSGFCVDTVCCSARCDGVCQACTATLTDEPTGTCAPKLDGMACRPSAGACDVAETCRAGACPADGFASGTVCRVATGACDVEERCTGQSASCPSNVVVDAGAVCRPAAGVCDAPETCDGAGGDCPADTYLPPTTVCRPDAGACDVAETCTGASADCPMDGFAPSSVVCRPAAQPCDAPESCTGAGPACPSDARASAGTVCRPAAGPCDRAEVCSGQSTACPSDTFLDAGASVCAPGRCSGTAAQCVFACTQPSDCFPGAKSVCVASTCQTGRLVFLTQNARFGGQLGGLDGGDLLCGAEAADAGLSGRFVAWLSDPTGNPSTRFTRDGGAWIRPDKVVVAASWTDLTDTTLQSPITLTARGTDGGVGLIVWTGTSSVGLPPTTTPNSHCGGWNSSSASGWKGFTGVTDSTWTSHSPAYSCNNGAYLYCFEQ